jgi:hypothetical protein
MTMKNFGIATVPLAPTVTLSIQNYKHDISSLLMNIGKSNSLCIFPQKITTLSYLTKLKLSYIHVVLYVNIKTNNFQ